MRALSAFLKTIMFAACLLGLAVPSHAQTYEAVRLKIEQSKQTLREIEAALARDLKDADLAKLRAQTDPITQKANSLLAELQPAALTLKSRLDQLKQTEAVKPTEPAPSAQAESELRTTAPNAATASQPTEPSSQTSLEQSEIAKQASEVSALIMGLNEVLLTAEKINRTIAKRRRQIFTHETFARTISIVSPTLWGTVLRELPGDVAAITTITGDFLTIALPQWPIWFLAALVYGFGLLLAFFAPVRKLITKILTSPHMIAGGERLGIVLFDNTASLDQPKELMPNALARSFASIMVLAVSLALPVMCLLCANLILESFDVQTARLVPLSKALTSAFLITIAVQAISHSLLVSRAKPWQLFALDGAVLVELQNTITTLVSVFIITRVVDAVAEIIVASFYLSALVRSFGAMLIAILLMQCLARISARIEARAHGLPDTHSESADVEPPSEDVYGLLRLLCWCIAGAILLASLLGYVALASFLTLQLLWATGVCSLLFLLLSLAHELCLLCFEPTSKIGSKLINTLGMRPESLRQIGTLGDGLLRVALYGVAGLLLVAPWGVQSEDMLTTFSAALFGFKVGDVTISLAAIVTGIAVFLGVVLVTKAIQKWLNTKFLPLTNLDIGLRNSITTSLGYVGFIIAVALSFAYLGLSFDRLAIVAGALSVGIGFGLQSIVSNFVSGLILLWERSIRVGDWVVVGEDQGIVRKINVRATEIDTFDRASVIVPNSNLVSGIVKNWVRTDKIGRIKIDLNLGYDVDSDAARDLLIAAAKAHPSVVGIPAPQVFLIALNDFAMRFELLCFVEDIEEAARVKSDLHFDILRRLNAQGIKIPAPRQTIDLTLQERPEFWSNAIPQHMADNTRPNQKK